MVFNNHHIPFLDQVYSWNAKGKIMRLARVVVPVMFCALISCGGGGGTSGAPTPSAPTPSTPTPGTPQSSVPAPLNFRAVTGLEDGHYNLRWDPVPSGTIDDYVLGLKVGSGEWDNSYMTVRAGNPSLGFGFSEKSQEDTDYTYRMTAIKNGVASDYSDTAVVHSGLHAPSLTSALYEWERGGVVLSWVRNTSLGTGVRIQRRELDAYGAPLADWAQLTGSAPLDSYLDTTITLGKYYAYQVINTKSTSVRSVAETSASVFTGLLPPGWISSYWGNTPKGVTVSWQIPATRYDSFLIERAPCDAWGRPNGDWLTVANPSGSTASFLDASNPELAQVLYRVSGVSGTRQSAAKVTGFLVKVPLLAPTSLVAVPAPGGIQLTWQNPSQAATQVAILRGAGMDNVPIAVLPAATGSFLDPNPPLGYYTYQVVTQKDQDRTYGPTVMVGTPNPPGTLAFEATPLSYTGILDASLRPSGSWAFLMAYPFGIFSDNDPWTPIFPDYGRSTVGGGTLQVDAQCWPHAVYAAADPDDGQKCRLTHLWFDGTIWKSEIMAIASVSAYDMTNSYRFCLDRSGTPRAVVNTVGDSLGRSTANLIYVHKVEGVWKTDSLAGLNPAMSSIGAFQLQVDGADGSHLLLGDGSAAIEYVPAWAGGWTSTILPTAQINSRSNDFLDGRWLDANTASVFFQRSGSGGTQFMVIQKVAGVWQLPVLLGIQGSSSIPTAARIASSPDRTRLVALWNTDLGVKCFHQVGNAWVETLVAAPLGSSPYLRMGIDGNGKVGILAGSNPATFHTQYREK